ncbi:hypothetical protein phiOC_p027 [Ochrobactrum phage vB_OspM_OC]|nr:hypothetical protein phiOC_p027 [Ochrobactrum phage vB_OspM_OC]
MTNISLEDTSNEILSHVREWCERNSATTTVRHLDRDGDDITTSSIINFDPGDVSKFLIGIPIHTFDIGEFDIEIHGRWTGEKSISLTRKQNHSSWNDNVDMGLIYILHKIQHYNKGQSVLYFTNLMVNNSPDVIICYNHHKNEMIFNSPIDEESKAIDEDQPFNCIVDLLNVLKTCHTISTNYYGG